VSLDDNTLQRRNVPERRIRLEPLKMRPMTLARWAVRALRWAAASDQQAEQMEQAQEELAQGPCIDAFWQRAPVPVRDVTREGAQEIEPPHGAGLHAGEVELRDGDVGGIAVHIAARVMATAGAGEIVVSRTVRDLVVGSDIALDDRGTQPLKGMEGRWQLFAVVNC
jgi:class 3 adenylate cyclase